MPRKPYLYHYIYKTICTVSNNYYIGMHSTSNIEDGYMGSGKRLGYSINKHGRNNHIMEILEYLPDRKTLGIREKEIVNFDLLNDPLCMNLKIGGEYSSGTYCKKYSDESKLKMSSWIRPKELGDKIGKKLSGKKLSKEHCDNISKAKTGKKWSETRERSVSDECKKQISESLTGRKLSDETKLKMSISKAGIPKSEETKQNMKKPKPIVECPHCKKTGGSSQMTRWHFDNCKQLQ